MTGDIPVRRGDPESGGEALGRAKAYLARGHERDDVPGGDAEHERDACCRSSPARSASRIEAGVPVLPVAVSGTAHGMPKGGPWVRPCRAHRADPRAGARGGLRPEDAPRLRDVVRERIAAALPSLPPA